MNERKEPVVRVKDETCPLSQSQTGKLGITKAEFQTLVITILSETKSRSRPVRPLLRVFLSRMGIRTHSKSFEEYLKDFMCNLRMMRDKELVEFVSGKTKLNVRLPRAK